MLLANTTFKTLKYIWILYNHNIKSEDAQLNLNAYKWVNQKNTEYVPKLQTIKM